MSLQQLTVWILLALGTFSSLLAAFSLLIVRDIYLRLHYLSLASSIPAVCITAAIVVQKGISQSSGEAIIALVIVVITSPVITHATARAIRVREFGNLEIQPLTSSNQK